MRTRAKCGVSECDQLADWLGYCNKHAQRFKKYGDPRHVTRPHDPQGDCSVDGCELRAISRSMCSKHLTRWRKHGDVNYNERPQYGTDRITYGGAHLRTRKARGRASEHACAHCSGPARHWAYDHEDANQKVDPTSGLTYSADPNHYIPLCTPCHKRYDLDWNELSEVGRTD